MDLPAPGQGPLVDFESRSVTLGHIEGGVFFM